MLAKKNQGNFEKGKNRPRPNFGVHSDRRVGRSAVLVITDATQQTVKHISFYCLIRY